MCWRFQKRLEHYSSMKGPFHGGLCNNTITGSLLSNSCDQDTITRKATPLDDRLVPFYAVPFTLPRSSLVLYLIASYFPSFSCRLLSLMTFFPDDPRLLNE